MLGPNRAGKTTAVRVLTTLLRHEEGRAEDIAVRRPTLDEVFLPLTGSGTGAALAVRRFARLSR